MKKLLSMFLVLILVSTGSFMGCSKKSDSVRDINTSAPETEDGFVGNGKPSATNGDAKTVPSYGSPQTDVENDYVQPKTSEEFDITYDAGASAGTLEGATDSTASVPEDTQDTSQYRYWNNNYPSGGNTEEYSEITEIGFKDTFENPLSTFSIDVDTASYTNLRKNLNNGIIPEADAVRIEEMLNYFNYEYAEPTGKVPFTINTEIGKCPWNEENYLLIVGIQGKNVDKKQLPKSNLVFLIDVSGSMNDPDKLPLLKSAFSNLTEVLGENDRVSIVAYSDYPDVVLDSVPGSDKDIILNAINDLSSGGSTGGSGGIDQAYRLAEKNYIEGGNNRIILATDGDFNVGPSSVEDLKSIITEKRESGIFLSVMGFGSGNLKDNRMETLADKGNGNYSYIDSVKEAKKVLVEEMAGTLLTIAKDVKIQLEFNPYSVTGYRLIGYENRALADEDFENDTVDAGELGAGTTVTAVYEITPSGTRTTSEKDLRYQAGETEQNAEYRNEISQVSLRYKEPDGVESKEIRRVVSFQNTPVSSRENSEDFYFAAAVVEFGMILRDSEYLGDATLDAVMELAEKGLGEDEGGYRLEFMNLVDLFEENFPYQWYYQAD